jgi:hypothetical protein
MAMKGITTSEDLHDEMKKLLQMLNIPVEILFGVVMDGALSNGRKEQWLSLPKM